MALSHKIIINILGIEDKSKNRNEPVREIGDEYNQNSWNIYKPLQTKKEFENERKIIFNTNIERKKGETAKERKKHYNALFGGRKKKIIKEE